MSRVIIERYDSGEEHLVIGWDRPLATYFWQVMGEGDQKGYALKAEGNWPNQLPTWQVFMNSLPKEFENKFSEKVLRPILQSHQDGESNVRIDTTDWPGWTIEVIADNSGEWVGNAVVMPDKEQAEAYARDLESRWFLVREWRVVRSPEQPNYTMTDDGRFLVVK